MMAPGILTLRKYQVEAIDAVLDAYGRALKRPAVVLPTGSGKGHPAHTEVPTPDGVRKWGDLRAGDHVFGSDGRPTEVLEVYRRGVLATFDVTFSDGSSVQVDGDHLWSVRDAMFRRTTRESRTMSTMEIMREGLRFGRARRFSIPLTLPVSRPAATLPIDPYTLGALIGNGSLAGVGTQLTTPDPEVIARVRRAHPANKIADVTPGVCARYSLPGLTKAVRELGLDVLSADKHIPAAYLEAPVADRVALLQGLMDTDGSSRAGGRRSVLYSTTSVRLASDMVELVTSLGGTASPHWTERVRPGRPVSVECMINILLPEEVPAFHSGRKVRPEVPRRVFPPRRAIVSITPAGDQEITCIRVAAADRLYLVTRHHLITHNTVIFSHLAKTWNATRPGKVVILVHRDELVNQTVDKLHAVAPMLTAGVVKGSRNEIDADVIVASVQTLTKPARLFPLLDKVGLVIVDECHHAAAATYRRVLEEFGCFDPPNTGQGAVAVGFTATMSRADSRSLGEVWEEVVYTKDILDMIALGYLADVRGKLVTVDGMSLEDVKRSRGDYQASSLSDILQTSGAITAVADAYLEHAKGLRTILFAPTVESARLFSTALEERGVRSAVVWGAMGEDLRRRTLRQFDAGEFDVICNCMVLTEGFDSPAASCAVIARPTTSAALYVQMVGRVLRPYPGKDQALVLDVAGASQMHDLATIADLSTRRIPEIVEGESITEAAERAIRQGALDLSGDVAVSDVELFRRSRSLWRQTYAGCWFISTKTRILFIWPEDGGTFKVGLRSASGASGGFAQHGLDLTTAMSWAEQQAEELDSSAMRLTTRDAAWRRKGGQPTARQIDMATGLGLDVTGKDKAGVSDMIDIHLTSSMLDRAFRNVMARLEASA
jgi:superfamily II DNA or RNA helicase